MLTQTATREENIKEFNRAVARREDKWVVGCGGLEEPFTSNGTRYLYCYNPWRHSHAYLNLDTDVAMPEIWFPTNGR